MRVFCRVRSTENEVVVKCVFDGSLLNLKCVEGKEDVVFEFDCVFDLSVK